MALKKYNKLLTSGRWSIKDHKDDQILGLVGVAQKIANDSKKSYDKSNMESTKGDAVYIRDIPPWIMEYPKGGVKKTEDEQNW